MDLIAKLPCVAAKIYRNLYREGSSIGAIDPNLDWSHNFTNMLGYTDPQFIELMRLYLTIHRYGAGRSSWRPSRWGLGPSPSPGARGGAGSWDMPGLLRGRHHAHGGVSEPSPSTAPVPCPRAGPYQAGNIMAPQNAVGVSPRLWGPLVGMGET